MTISLKADPGGTSGAIQINGTDLLTISTTGIQVPGDVQATSFNGGQQGGFRNLVINGQFFWWQRGSSLAAAAATRYLADRFVTAAVGTTVAPALQAFTAGQTQVPFNPTYFHRCVNVSSAGAGNFSALIHRLEDVTYYSSVRVTLSFWAKADANKNIAVEFTQNFGGGGSPQVSSINVTTCALTVNWQKFIITMDFPSVAGKTITAGNYASITFWMDAGSTFNARTNSLGQQSGTFDFANVQFEYGSVATPFEKREVGVEYTQCRRFYEFGTSFLGGYVPAAAASFGYFIPFTVQKRATPIVVLGAAANTGVAGAANTTSSAQTVGFILGNSPTAAGSLTISNIWNADAEL